MSEQKPGDGKTRGRRKIDTGGGAYFEGVVDTDGGAFFGGNVSAGGDVVGRDQRNISYNQPPDQECDPDKELADLRQALETLQAQLEQVIAAGEIANAGRTQDARAALRTVEEELAVPEPDGERVVCKLEEATTILNTNGKTAEAAERVGLQ